MDDKILEDILARKESELIVLEKREMEIRHNITDEDYTTAELADREKGVRILPEKIIYKIRPFQQTATKLRIEIRCIRNLLRESEKDVA